MSTQLTKEIICPQCGEGCKLNLTPGINAVDNPELKEAILNETLFDWICPRCGYGAMIMYPLVYHDPKEGYMITMYSKSTKGNKIEAPSSISGVVKRRVKTLAELKEKILIFDAGLDDVAVELVKNALEEIIHKSYGSQKIKIHFSRIAEEGSLEFAIFVEGKKEAIYHAVKSEVYDQSEEVLRSLDFSEPNDFLRVGPTLAKKILEQYRSI
jgi:hypothetical protein